MIMERNMPFITNPFQHLVEDPFFSREASNFIKNQNNKLLFEYGDINNKNIYICLAEDVLRFATEKGLSNKYFLDIYYPNLSIDTLNINSLDTLRTARPSLIDKDNKQIDDNSIEEYNEKINLFYKLFDTKTTKQPYVSNGIEYINFVIHPLDGNITFPLEIIFKIISSSKKIPMIKFNPGKTRENI